jgi:hypothetical protein
MRLTIELNGSWWAHPAPLGRLLDHLKALEGPAPYAPPPPARLAGDDGDLGFGELLDGMDAPAKAPISASTPAPKPARSPAPSSPAGAPLDGKHLYAWTKDRDLIKWGSRLGTEKTLENVVVHFFIVRQQKPGQKEIPDLKSDVLLESAFDMDFKPGGKAGQRSTVKIETPGAYLVRVETRNTQSDHEHFSAIDLVVIKEATSERPTVHP